MLSGIQSAGYPLPDYQNMTDHVREIAVYIRDTLGLKNCQVIQFEGCLPPQWAVVFSDEIIRPE
jgi:hypothetical protein